jgi:hypothetical protein
VLAHSQAVPGPRDFHLEAKKGNGNFINRQAAKPPF